MAVQLNKNYPFDSVNIAWNKTLLNFSFNVFFDAPSNSFGFTDNVQMSYTMTFTHYWTYLTSVDISCLMSSCVDVIHVSICSRCLPKHWARLNAHTQGHRTPGRESGKALRSVGCVHMYMQTKEAYIYIYMRSYYANYFPAEEMGSILGDFSLS